MRRTEIENEIVRIEEKRSGEQENGNKGSTKKRE